MKQFYYKIDKETTRKMGGRNVKVSIYELKEGKLATIGNTSWNTASFKGDESEVLDFLINKGLVSKASFPDRYYRRSLAEEAGISIELI